jgi:hypothetical protein
VDTVEAWVEVDTAEVWVEDIEALDMAEVIEGLEEGIEEDIVTDLIEDGEIITLDGITHTITTTMSPTNTYGGITGLDTHMRIKMDMYGIMDIPTLLITDILEDTLIEISVTTN